MEPLYILGYIVFTVSCLNLIRIGSFSVISDYYDFKNHRGRLKPVKYTPFISVIVPAHNERLVLERCLDSIYASNYKNFEVIVVDDGSSDTTTRFGHFLRLKHGYKNLHVVRKRQNGGKASAINYGVKKYARGSIIVVMDADCTLDQDALARGGRYFRDPKITALASNVKVMRGNNILLLTQLMEYMLAYRLKKALSVLNIEYLAGCTSFFRKSAIVNADYYDEDTVAEDFDFSLKLIRGHDNSIIYGEDVLCYTEGVKSLSDLYRQRFRWRFGSFQAFYKNRSMFFSRTERLSKFLTWILLPWLLACEFLFLLEPVMVGTIIYTAIRYHYFAGLLYGFGFYGAIVMITALSDEYISRAQRRKLLLLAPIAYPLFMIINYVGYASLVKSLIKSRRIVNLKIGNSAGWASPKRDATQKA